MNTTTVDVTLVASSTTWLIGLGLAIILTVIAIWAKSSIIFLGALICWIGAYVEIPMQNTFYNVGIGIMAVFCILMGFFNYQNKRRSVG